MRNGFTYEPKNISRDNITSSTDLFQSGLRLTLPLTDPMAQTYIGTTVEDVVKVKVLSNVSGDYYSAGMLEFRGAKRFIESQVGNVITLTRRLNNEEIGEAIVYAGYSHSIEDCRDKFDNLFNYGGFLYIDDDPFTLGNIFNKG